MEKVSFQAQALIEAASRRVAEDAKGASDRDVQLMCTGVIVQAVHESMQGVMMALPCSKRDCPYLKNGNGDKARLLGKLPLPDGVTVYIPRALLVAAGGAVVWLLQHIKW